jgi:hypothetical protein
MCVIIVQPAGKYLSKTEAADAWKTNPDGGGYAFIDPNTNTIKGYKSMQFEDFWRKFERDRSDHRNQDFLIHMRIATHGSVCIDNVHPFQVDEYTVMAHNGIIHEMPSKDPDNLDRSDTRMFIDFVLPDLPKGWLDHKYISDMVAEWIGWSKIAFLTTDPNLDYNIYILNQKKGDWRNDMWYSNLNHIKPAWKGNQKSKNAGYVIKNGQVTEMSDSYEGWTWNGDADEYISTEAWNTPTKIAPTTTFDNIDEVILSAETFRTINYANDWPLNIDGDGDLYCCGCSESVSQDEDWDCSCWDLFCESCYHMALTCGCDDTWRRLQSFDDFPAAERDTLNKTLEDDVNDLMIEPIKTKEVTTRNALTD